MAIKFKTDMLNQMDKVCREYGYYIGTISKFGDIPDVHIEPLSGQEYMPTIYQEGVGESLNGFYAQTASYGALRISEYEKFLDACQRAFNLIKYLNDLDLSVIGENDWYYEKKLNLD